MCGIGDVQYYTTVANVPNLVSGYNDDKMINLPLFMRIRMTPSRFRILAGLAAILLSQSSPAASQHGAGSIDDLYTQGQREMPASWRGVGKSHDAAVFMHNDRRREGDGRIAAWMHRELASAEYFEKEKPYLSIRERVLVDCKASRLGITDVAYYGERFARGAVVGGTKFKAPDMSDPVPDSIEDQAVRILCAPKARQAPSQRQKAASP